MTKLDRKDIFLKKTDTIELSEITIKDRVYKTVVLEGNVEIGYENGFIEADKIVINLDTKELQGRGNIKLTGERKHHIW